MAQVRTVNRQELYFACKLAGCRRVVAVIEMHTSGFPLAGKTEAVRRGMKMASTIFFDFGLIFGSYCLGAVPSTPVGWFSFTSAILDPTYGSEPFIDNLR